MQVGQRNHLCTSEKESVYRLCWTLEGTFDGSKSVCAGPVNGTDYV